MRAKELASYLEFTLKNNLPVLIKGPPGGGKTDIGTQAANKLTYDLMVTHPVVDEPIDYKGMPFVVNGKANFIPFGNLERMIYADRPLVVFLDDLGQATPAVQSAVMQLLLSRTINGKLISDHVRFLAATNRREDRANVSGILEPVKSRFLGGIVELEIHTEDWIEWAWANGMPSELISFIQFRPDMLFEHKPTRDIENSSNPRTVAGVGDVINLGISAGHRFEAFKGIAGESFAVEFEAYNKIFLNLPSIHEIEAEPNTAIIPNEASAKFAVMGMLAGGMTPNNLGSFITYLERLGNEMLVAGMKNASMKNPALYSTQEFVNFGIRYGGLLVN